MTSDSKRDPVQDAFDTLRTETQGLDTMEPLRSATNHRISGAGGRPSRWPLVATASVLLAVVVGLAAWLSQDDGQPIDTDVAGDGTTDDGDAPAPVELDSLPGSTWTLRAGGGPGGDITLVDGYPITLTFEADSFGGTAACNGYGSAYSIDGNQIAIEGISATEMGCEPAVQAAEQAYLAALADVTDITLGDDELVLGGPSTELIFTRQQPAPTEELIETLWLLDTLIRGQTAGTVLGDPATLLINRDGSFAGSTGCRTFSGRYQTFGSDVQFNEFAAGPEQCPTELREQDNHVFSVLGDGFTAEIDGGRLTVSSSGGDGLGYRAVTEDELAETAPRPVASDAELLSGVEWVLVAGYDDPGNPDEVTIDPSVLDPAQRPTIIFVDGRIRGFSGCNGFSGTAQVGNGSITVDEIASEGQACDPAVDEIGGRYTDGLEVMTEFGLERDGQQLVMNGEGIELHFERAE